MTTKANPAVIQKTGDFETDVRSGYYAQERNAAWNAKTRSYEDYVNTFDPDLREFLRRSGVPEQYVAKVANYAYEQGHSSGESEILNVAYGLIDIFEAPK
jgi:hypothetical protein